MKTYKPLPPSEINIGDEVYVAKDFAWREVKSVNPVNEQAYIFLWTFPANTPHPMPSTDLVRVRREV